VQKETEKEDGRLEEQNVTRQSNKPRGQFVGICQMHVINCFGRTCTIKINGSFSPHQRLIIYSYSVLIGAQLGDAEIHKCKVLFDLSEEQSRTSKRCRRCTIGSREDVSCL
jgi:hypothetical protein